MSYEKRRSFPRQETSVEVNYEHGMESFTDYTINLSLGGLYIKTTRPLETGSIITVDFTLPGFAYSFRIKGKVVWKKSAETDEGPPGMGIEFTELSKADEAILLQYIGRSQLTQKGY
ncbi:MAG: TIGR02266 family protein [bacterium]|nr:TIGR02266 family protein [bacterium]